MSNNLKVWLPTVLAVVLAFGIVIGLMLGHSGNKLSLFSANKSSEIDQVINYIGAKYVDTVNTEKLSEGAIQDLLSHLDPQSVFIPSSELADVNQELQGNFEGIGIEFFRISDTVTVVNVIIGGPSDRARLKKGDKIVTVNDTL